MKSFGASSIVRHELGDSSETRASGNDTSNVTVDGQRPSTNLQSCSSSSSCEAMATGAVDIDLLSDRRSIDVCSADDSGSRKEKLENELRISKELIHSLKLERQKLRANQNDLLSQVKQLCLSLQHKEQQARNSIHTYEQSIRQPDSTSTKQNTDRSE
ncbi:AGAP007137-PB-like protein [Anopheles sinensis]|uniref:AGAP007137-PB-like protein n=1 Tax=Anopheles sinensis TaxID=74873 RepID=A0A084VJL9_ANOSI|nr:AGAP007137-PB-like protein [Anopheles sinensis]